MPDLEIVRDDDPQYWRQAGYQVGVVTGPALEVRLAIA
jgi:hypothetical protein